MDLLWGDPETRRFIGASNPLLYDVILWLPLGFESRLLLASSCKLCNAPKCGRDRARIRSLRFALDFRHGDATYVTANRAGNKRL